MGIVFNAEEIYQIGVEIEKNGETFYTIAASTMAGTDLKKLFDELSAWERGHVTLFEGLIKGLPKDAASSEQFDPDRQKSMYLKAIADGHVFIMNKDIQGLVSTCRDAVSILRLALNFEKDSVALYTSMKAVVPPRLGQAAIERLINEEIQHVAMLQQKIAALNAA